MPEQQTADVLWADERFTLSPWRVAYWPRRRTLLVADMHLGKPAAFRHAGVPVPEECTHKDLATLSAALDHFPSGRLVILGDLLHARTARCPLTLAAFAQWRARRPALDILLVRGNHDERAGDPPADWHIRVVDEPFSDPDDDQIAFAHHPEAAPRSPGKWVLSGHIHPAVRLSRGARSLRAPCFWFGDRVGVFPSFGSFTGSAVVSPASSDQVFVVGDDAVVPVGAPARHASTQPIRP